MLLEEGLDTGPILLQQSLPIAPEQSAADLFDLLAVLGAPLVVETLAGLDKGNITPQVQDHAKATLAPILEREDGRMDFAARAAMELVNRWRGFQPWPGAFTSFDGKKLIVHGMRVTDAQAESADAGTVVVKDKRMLIACAQNTWLELLEVQLEGKKRIAAAEFLRGLQPGHATIRLG
jgi:methionyl-tRNA formyltransferase